MSRRSVTRAVCAPIAIAIITTAAPPAVHNHEAISRWSGEKLAIAATYTSAGLNRLGEDFGKHAQKGTEKAAQLREDLANRLSATTAQVREELANRASATADSIASRANAALARVDEWMTSVSQSVIAMLPARSEDPAPATAAPVEARAPAAEAPQQTASLSAVTVTPAVSLPGRIEIAPEVMPPVSAIPAQAAPKEQPAPAVAIESPAPRVVAQEPAREAEAVSAPAPAEKMVVAALGALENATVAIAPAAHAATRADIKIEARPVAVEPLVVPAAPDVLPQAKAAPALDAKILPAEKPLTAKDVKITLDEPARVIDGKTHDGTAEQKLVVASLGNPDALADTAPASAPELAVEFKTPAPKAEDKLVVASLGNPASAAGREPAPAAAGIKAVPDSSPEDRGHIIDPLQLTNVPMSSPLKIRALTRADLPSKEKLASLGPSGAADAHKLPPEQQRVAYDAPVEAETPISIGRRRFTEEAAKYQGLGSPEALLEALKHMGEGARSLGLPASLWCADFMNLVLRKSGIPATGSRAARSYLQYGQKIDEPRVGAIAIFSRGGANSGHVGIVRGTDGNGNPIIVSGNHNHKVAEATYPKSRVIAYVVPK